MSLSGESLGRDLLKHDVAVSERGSKKRFFYCPFEPHFHAQARYQVVPLDAVTDCSTCPLTSIKRLKDHIRKSHQHKGCLYNCDRCMGLFSSEESLKQHRQQNPNCYQQPSNAPTTLTVKQENAVEEERYGLDDTEYWYAIFQGLFPNTPLPISPYWDSERPKESFLPPVPESTIYTGGSIDCADMGQENVAAVEIPVGSALLALESLSKPNLEETRQNSIAADEGPTEVAAAAFHNTPRPQQLVQQESDLTGILSSRYTYTKLTKSALLRSTSTVYEYTEHMNPGRLPSKSLVDSGYGSQDAPSVLSNSRKSSTWKRPSSKASTGARTMRSLHSIAPHLPTIDPNAEHPEDHLTNPLLELNSETGALGHLESDDLSETEDLDLELFMEMPPKIDVLACSLLDVGCKEEPIELRFKHFDRLGGVEFFIWTAESNQLGDFGNMNVFNTSPQGHEGIHSALLPPAFRDVVKMTRNLGCRYLWNKELCNVHSDRHHHPTQNRQNHPPYQMASAIIKATSLFNPYYGLNEWKDEWLERSSPKRGSNLRWVNAETYAIRRWLQTPVRDDCWSELSKGRSVLGYDAAALPVYYFSPSYTSRRHQGLLNAIASRGLHRARLWTSVNSMSLLTLIDSRRIMQLLRCLNIRAVHGTNGTSSRSIRLVHPALPSRFAGAPFAVPFLWLYTQSKNMEYQTQLRFLEQYFYGVVSACQSNNHAEQNVSQRPALHKREGEPSRARKARKQAHRSKRRGPQDSPMVATGEPLLAQTQNRLFRCPLSAAREQGINRPGDIRNTTECDRCAKPSLVRLRAYELVKCHGLSSEFLDLPKDTGITDYTDEDTWNRWLLKIFPCYLYNCVPLPDPYSRTSPDHRIPHVSRYDPESLGFTEEELANIARDQREFEARANVPTSQPIIAETLSRVFPEHERMFDGETIDPALLIRPPGKQHSLVPVDSPAPATLLMPNAEPGILHPPHAAELENVTPTIEPVYEMNFPELSPVTSLDFLHSLHADEFTDFATTAEPFDATRVFSIGTGDGLSIGYSSPAQHVSTNTSTPPTSQSSKTPLDSLNICFCENTRDWSEKHYQCAHENRCGPCGKWSPCSTEGKRIIQRWAMDVGRGWKPVTGA